MTHTKMQDHYYYMILKSRRETRWLADERVKKQFLDQLLKVRDRNPFRIYAFCILDEGAHFLLSISRGRNMERTADKILRELQKSYRSYYPREVEGVVELKRLLPGSYMAVFEYCCRIHLLARECAGKMQDYWWSSYVEYLHRNITGLVETETILRALDSEPRRAVQKFVQYHKKYALIIDNGLQEQS